MSNDLLQVARSTRYPIEGFIFVQRGLDYTVRRIHGELPDDATDNPRNRHVSGVDLCHGLKRFAVQQYGLLARTVLKRWNIVSCEDFGRIVFAMVDAELMYKTDEDTLEEFIGVFDFDEAFEPDLILARD